MAANNSSPPPTPTLEERRKAVYVLLGLLAAFAVALIAVGTWIYHKERDKHQEALSAQPAEPKPSDPLKAAEQAKENEKKQALPFGKIAGAMATHPLFLFCLVNCLFLGFGCLVFGSQLAADEQGALSPSRPAPPLKLLVMGVGGLVGFTTTLFLGLGYAIYWWTDLSAGGLKVWREGWTWLLVAAAFGGLIITFLSLLAVKSEERHNPTLRRLLYGFNAFLVGFLLLAVLAVANGLFLIYANVQAIDWTKNQQASLSPAMKKALAALEKPVEVYVMLGGDPTGLTRDVTTLLDNCKGYAPKLEWRLLDATSEAGSEKIRDLMRKYDMLFQEGMLVVWDPAGENSHLFIKRYADGPDDLGLEDQPRMTMREDDSISNFRGEQALLTALGELSEGKAKSVIYVTQDSGEFSLTDNLPPGGQRDRRSRSLSLLRTKLEKAGYKVEPWQLGAVDEKTRQTKPIPDDAAVVLVAGADASIAAKLRPLEDYMKRPAGRLFLFLEPTRDREGRIQPSGFEAFLKKFGAIPGNDLIVHLPTDVAPQPTSAVIYPVVGETDSPQTMDPRLAEAYDAQQAFLPLPFGETRTVRFGPAEGFDARPLLATYYLMDRRRGVTGQWPVTDPIPDVEAYLESLMRTRREELDRKLLTPPLPVAVTVAERGEAAPPARPGMPPPPPKPGTPRLAVFGSTMPLHSGNLERNPYNFFFVTSTLNWLKNKSVAIDRSVQVKPRQFYTVRVPPGEEGALRWQPLFALLALIILIGVGVGLLRRR